MGVTTADVSASNGVVHIIDTVLIPKSMSAPAPTSNIVQLAVATKDLSTLVTALKAGKLVGALSGKGPFTVFAPTNEAFGKVPSSTLKMLLDPKNIHQLDQVLEYHVVSGNIHSNQLKSYQNVPTLEGQKLLIQKHSTGVVINHQAKVTTADVAATNGVVHIIDTVLIPHDLKAPKKDKPTKSIVQLAVGNHDLSTLVTALKADNLVGALSGKGPFTVFAPTNQAFDKVPSATLKTLLDPKNVKMLDQVLEYHVVAGAAVYSKDLKSWQNVKTLEGQTLLVQKHSNGVTINHQAKVTTADVGATNGVVHIIDTVLIPHDLRAPATTQNIVELAVATKDLSTLVTALKAGNLVSALEGKGPFTVFAPTNEAFAKVPSATLKSLLDPKNVKLLDQVLEYHVVSGNIHSKQLHWRQSVKTLEGQNLLIEKHSSGVVINRKAKVTTADVGATNGVVHIIDTVLIPKTAVNKCDLHTIPKDLQHQYAMDFQALDKNNNGYVDTKEFKDKGKQLADVFTNYRKNKWSSRRHNRRLGSSFWGMLTQRMKERADAMRAARIFSQFDTNHSRQISLCEFEKEMYKLKKIADKEDIKNFDDGGVVVVHG